MESYKNADSILWSRKTINWTKTLISKYFDNRETRRGKLESAIWENKHVNQLEKDFSISTETKLVKIGKTGT